MRPDLTFQVIFAKDRTYLSSPTVLTEFGRAVRVEVPGEVRVEAMAREPDAEGRSFVSAKLFVYSEGGWQEAGDMSSNRMMLSATPSFERVVEGTPYRVTVMPRVIVPASSDD